MFNVCNSPVPGNVHQTPGSASNTNSTEPSSSATPVVEPAEPVAIVKSSTTRFPFQYTFAVAPFHPSPNESTPSKVKSPGAIPQSHWPAVATPVNCVPSLSVIVHETSPSHEPPPTTAYAAFSPAAHGAQTTSGAPSAEALPIEPSK